jgi:hypothetical protein
MGSATSWRNSASLLVWAIMRIALDITPCSPQLLKKAGWISTSFSAQPTGKRHARTALSGGRPDGSRVLLSRTPFEYLSWGQGCGNSRPALCG